MYSYEGLIYQSKLLRIIKTAYRKLRDKVEYETFVRCYVQEAFLSALFLFQTYYIFRIYLYMAGSKINVYHIAPVSE